MEELKRRVSGLGYKFIQEFKQGGQAQTFLLSKDEKNFILKVPKDKNLSKERKFRLKREIEALRMLNGEGVPQIYESETDRLTFIIMEFIKGKTLSEFCNGKSLDYQVAKSIFIKLLDIVGYAHSLGLYHRDLKPDNIIIRESDNLPIVIDFGICWFTNEENKANFHTNTKVELGNRFLRLPELSKGSNVTISTSDITFLVGIFYFSLTGKSPNVLLNESGELPHYRIDSNKLKELDEWKFLKYLFDKGFTHELSLRYQTASELKNVLTEMEENSYNKSKSSKSALTETLKGQKIKRIDTTINLVKEAHKKFLDTYRKEILEELVYGGSGPNYSEKNRQVNTSMFLVRRGTSEPQVRFFLISEFDENFSIINSQYGTTKSKYFKEHTVNEKNRLLDDCANFGRQCADMTMSELNEILIELYK